MTAPASLATWAGSRLSRRTAGFILLGITAIGLVIRLVAWGQPVLGDELSTLWIVREYDLTGNPARSLLGRRNQPSAVLRPRLVCLEAGFGTGAGSTPGLAGGSWRDSAQLPAR